AHCSPHPPQPHSFPTRRSSDLAAPTRPVDMSSRPACAGAAFASPSPIRTLTVGPGLAPDPPSASVGSPPGRGLPRIAPRLPPVRSEEHTSELQSRFDLVCRLLP